MDFARPLLLSHIPRLVEPASQPSASAVPALPADIPATAERYFMLIMGNLAGQQAVWTAPDGTLHIFFQFNDRGRGPKTTSILKLDADGIPVSETVTGNDYLKAAVDESFTNAGAAARWKNNAEQGEKKISAPAFYPSLNGAPSETGLLAQAALHNGGKIALLPDGEARIQRSTELDIEASGHKKQVVLYSITGLDFSPTYVWLEGLNLSGAGKVRTKKPPPKIVQMKITKNSSPASIAGDRSSRRVGIHSQAAPRRARSSQAIPLRRTSRQTRPSSER